MDQQVDSDPTETLPATAVVMTFNEERNLPTCLACLAGKVDQIVVVDSFSTDKTLEIATSFGADVYQHKFVNQAKQYIWAMENCELRNEWVIRVDADERWMPEALQLLNGLIRSDSCDAVTVRMRIFFMGRWLRHGGMYPNLFLRAYKRSRGKMEDRWMDEHIAVDGRIANPPIDVLEQNYDRQENIGLWIEKHNRYSTREALENLLLRNTTTRVDSIADIRGQKTERKRWMKENAYARAPLFVRSYLYFLYRYLVQAGFLEGKEGLIFHTMHAFWYRFLVDVKIFQMEQIVRKEKCTIEEAIERHWGISV